MTKNTDYPRPAYRPARDGKTCHFPGDAPIVVLDAKTSSLWRSELARKLFDLPRPVAVVLYQTQYAVLAHEMQSADHDKVILRIVDKI